MKKTLLLLAFTSGTLLTSLEAATLATASFDSDSYVYVGTNNEFQPQITLSAYNDGGHYVWANIQFDVSGLSAQPKAYLELNPVQYKTGPNPMNPTITTTGTSTVYLVALNDSWTNYINSQTKFDWAQNNVVNATKIGTFNFNNTDSAYVNVTDTVNAWIDGSKSNYGFALWTDNNSVELASSTYSNTTLSPSLSTVPEASSAMLLALSSAGLLLFRKR